MLNAKDIAAHMDELNTALNKLKAEDHDLYEGKVLGELTHNLIDSLSGEVDEALALELTELIDESHFNDIDLEWEPGANNVREDTPFKGELSGLVAVYGKFFKSWHLKGFATSVVMSPYNVESPIAHTLKPTYVAIGEIDGEELELFSLVAEDEGFTLVAHSLQKICEHLEKMELNY